MEEFGSLLKYLRQEIFEETTYRKLVNVDFDAEKLQLTAAITDVQS